MQTITKKTKALVPAEPSALTIEPRDSADAFFRFGTLCLFVSVVGYSFFAPKRHWEMAIAAGASVVVMLMGRVHLFELIKAGAFEFKIRQAAEHAERAAEEAYATVKQLRGALEAFGRISMESLAFQDFVGTLPLARKVQARAEVAKSLSEFGVDQYTIMKLMASVDYVAKHTMALEIIQAARQRFATAEYARVDTWPALERELGRIDNWDAREVAPASVFRTILQQHGAIADDISELLSELEHYERTYELRTPARWNKSE